MSHIARKAIGEIIDRFADGKETPGDAWAPSEDRTSFGLDYQGRDGCKFWLDLDRDGTITLYWVPPSGERQIVKFTA